MDKFKDVTLGEGEAARKFRINRLPADIGSWVAFQIITSGTKMGEEEFRRAQGYLLAATQRLTIAGEHDIWEPIYVRESGIWVDKALQFDLVSVIALTMQAIEFNFDGFFGDSRMKPILAAFGITPAGPSQH